MSVPTVSQLDTAQVDLDTMYDLLGNYSNMILDKVNLDNFIFSAKSYLVESGLTSFELSNSEETIFVSVTKTQATLTKNVISKLKNFFNLDMLTQPSTLIDTPYSTDTNIDIDAMQGSTFLIGEIDYVVADELGLPLENLGAYDLKISVDGNLLFQKVYDVGQEQVTVKITVIKPTA